MMLGTKKKKWDGKIVERAPNLVERPGREPRCALPAFNGDDKIWHVQCVSWLN
jgi:hypothetical protein